MRYALLLLVLLFFPSSCSYDRQDIECDDIVVINTSIDREAIIYAINTYAVKVENSRKHKLVFEDSMIFYNEDHLQKIWLKFITQDLVTLWEARELLVSVVDGYVDRFNNDASLKWYLPNQELTPANIDVTVVFESFMGVYVDPLYVGSINLQDGNVYYYAFDAFDIKTDVWHQRVENYSKSALLHSARTNAKMFWDKREGAKAKSALELIYQPKPQPS